MSKATGNSHLDNFMRIKVEPYRRTELRWTEL